MPGGDLCLAEEAFLHRVHNLLGAREEQQDEQALHKSFCRTFLNTVFTYFMNERMMQRKNRITGEIERYEYTSRWKEKK